jgi:AcrR family transcriptional regulator
MSMTTYPRQRKQPSQRRGEILAAASRLALKEGLGSLTLRRVAETLGVAPGLVNHYFPVVDDLAAASFGHAAAAERDAAFSDVAADAPPLARMRAVLGRLVGEEGDAISLLWLDAWQASRNRPALRTEVALQMREWQAALAALIGQGVACGAFSPCDTEVAAVRILALVDGLSVQAAIRFGINYGAVRELAVETVERELGLKAGALR